MTSEAKWVVRLRVGASRMEAGERWIEEREVWARNEQDAIARATDDARAPYVHGVDNVREV